MKKVLLYAINPAEKDDFVNILKDSGAKVHLLKNEDLHKVLLDVLESEESLEYEEPKYNMTLCLFAGYNKEEIYINKKETFRRIFIKRKSHIDLNKNVLYKKYNEVDYPKYDNYDAINIDKVADIPVDYFGYMGVPITYIDKHNPNQFEIIDIDNVLVKKLTGKSSRFILNGKTLYARIVIKRKK